MKFVHALTMLLFCSAGCLDDQPAKSRSVDIEIRPAVSGWGNYAKVSVRPPADGRTYVVTANIRDSTTMLVQDEEGNQVAFIDCGVDEVTNGDWTLTARLQSTERVHLRVFDSQDVNIRSKAGRIAHPAVLEKGHHVLHISLKREHSGAQQRPVEEERATDNAEQ